MTAASGSVRLAVTVIGTEKANSTLVVVNGGAGLTHDYMADLDALATPSRRVVFYDQRGLGRSTWPHDPSGFAPEHQVADLEAVRRAVGADRIHILGHSWGGFPAMAYVLAKPEHVESLIFVGSVPPTWKEMGEGLARFRERRDELSEAGVLPAEIPEVEDGDCSEQLAAVLPAYFANPRHPNIQRLAGGISCRADVYERVVTAADNYDFAAELASIETPAVVIFGEKDAFGVLWATALARAFKIEPDILADCGHFPWLECPDAFYTRLNEHLAAHE